MTENEKQQLINYRMSRVDETLKEVEFLIDNGLYNTAINRLYYACFYAVTSLLVKHEIKAHKHAGVRQMFGLHFVSKGVIDKTLARFYTDLYDKRQTSDYDDFIDFDKEDVLTLIPTAKELINEIRKLLERE
ncbi:MAG: HEPN domain-containing protein [bacterium]